MFSGHQNRITPEIVILGVDRIIVKDRDRILMVSPSHRSQRGNSITTERIRKGLTARGFHIDLWSLEENSFSAHPKAGLDLSQYGLVHGFHALHFARFLHDREVPAKLPLMVTTTGTDLHFDLLGKEKSLIEGIFQKVHKIVVFHQDFIAMLARLNPGLSSRLVCIPQGIDLPQGRSLDLNPFTFHKNDFIFLLPSGLRPVKNLEMAINALERLQPDYPHLKLIIMGAALDAAYSQKILARIRSLPWVVYLGEIPHEQVGSIIKASHVVMNCSLAEGQPQGALEAMSLGLPCILSTAPGNLHIIEHGKEGFYVRDERELMQAAKNYIDDPLLAMHMGQAASVLAARKFSLADELDAYDNIYRQFAG